MKNAVSRFGKFLSGMVMPNIGAFIAWGFLTALFIEAGWFPNEKLASMVSPMLTYLLPILIAGQGGKMIAGDRGRVIAAIAVVGTVSMTWVGLLVINSLLVLPAAAARNVARNMRQYHLFSLLGAVISGLAGLMTSYYIGSSAGASITLYLAVWFAVTFLLRKKCI